MTVLYVFLMILMAVIMCLLPLALQFRNGINTEYFPKVKVNALGFLFKGALGKGKEYSDVKEYGVICPMFAIQVLGYVFAVISVILAPIVICVAEIAVWQTVLIVLYMLVAEAVICAVTTVVCLIISKKKDAKTN